MIRSLDPSSSPREDALRELWWTCPLWACPSDLSPSGCGLDPPFPNEVSQLLGGHGTLLHTMVEDLKAMVFVAL